MIFFPSWICLLCVFLSSTETICIPWTWHFPPLHFFVLLIDKRDAMKLLDTSFARASKKWYHPSQNMRPSRHRLMNDVGGVVEWMNREAEHKKSVSKQRGHEEVHDDAVKRVFSSDNFKNIYQLYYINYIYYFKAWKRNGTRRGRRAIFSDFTFSQTCNVKSRDKDSKGKSSELIVICCLFCNETGFICCRLPAGV